MKPKTKWMMLLVGVLVILSTNVNAELYGCRDRNGNPVITSSPSAGMTDCTLWDSSKDGDDVYCPGCSREKKEYIRMLRDECRKPMASKAKCDQYAKHLGIGATSKRQQRLDDMEEKLERQEAAIQEQERKIREAEWEMHNAEAQRAIERVHRALR